MRSRTTLKEDHEILRQREHHNHRDERANGPWIAKHHERRCLASEAPATPTTLNRHLGTTFGCGGDEGTRTPDPLLAKQMLSQLSYVPATIAVASAPTQQCT